jgi:hypothetical protein
MQSTPPMQMQPKVYAENKRKKKKKTKTDAELNSDLCKGITQPISTCS